MSLFLYQFSACAPQRDGAMPTRFWKARPWPTVPRRTFRPLIS